VPPNFKKKLQKPNLIGPSLKRKMKLWKLPKTKGSILKHRVSPLWLTYIGEGEQYLPNHMG
jgi:hypothetical protein